MPRDALDLRADALRIWHAGLSSVRSETLMRAHVRIDGRNLFFGTKSDNELPPIDLDCIRRIAVVGAGKAGAGMSQALEQILGPALMREKQLMGWVNVPADCVQPLQRIHLHPARPAGRNEPTAEGVSGTERILQIAGELGDDDLCIALISGGGSALTPAPIEGISLADKLEVTRFLSAVGADISELNTVRKQLSRFKGGGLARTCKAGRLVSLIISDVIGDPLDLIASGPTVADHSTPQEALDILAKYAGRSAISAAVFSTLERLRDEVREIVPLPRPIANLLIGNNATAVNSAIAEAKRLGYDVFPISSAGSDGLAEDLGRTLARYATLPQKTSWPKDICYVSGGECTVRLAPTDIRGLGGRNQQTVLAALVELQQRGSKNFVVLSGGTDGEDGPTDAAGAFVDTQVVDDAKQRNLDAAEHLRCNDAYHFFERLDALIKTGPTHTNVCDLRIVLVKRQ